MKYIARILALLLLFILPLGVLAQQSGKNVVLPAGRTVNGPYFASGGDVRVDGTVNGDAYVAGGTVTVSGQINGDLLVAGGTVMIRGPVAQDIRVAGGTVIITGEVGRNITAAGGTITLERGANVGGSVVAGGGTISLLAPIEENVVMGGGTIMVADRIGGNAQIDAGTITLASGAEVDGNLSYMSQSEAQIEQDATVSGQIRRQPIPQREPQEDGARGLIAGFVWGKIFSLIAMFIIGLMFIHFTPRSTKQIVDTVRADAWKSVGIGILILLITPIVMVFLFATLVGIPFAFILLFTYFLFLYVGKVFVAIYIGRWATSLAGKKVSDAWALFIGLILHMLITLIPVLGWLAGIFIMLWGAGALLIAKKELYHTYRKKDLL